ncbi:MAG: hypothetical protein ACLQVM_21530, partial [Terriglobia bacterium]
PGLPTARTIRCFRLRVPSPQKSSRLLLIKPAELLLFLTGADTAPASRHRNDGGRMKRHGGQETK